MDEYQRKHKQKYVGVYINYFEAIIFEKSQGFLNM